MSLKLEKVEDLLEVDIATLKSPDKTKLLTRLKALIKLGDKVEIKTDEQAKVNLPYSGVSVVGNKLITLKFDLESKEARVIDIEESTQHHAVITVQGMNMVKKFAKEQK